MQLEITLTADNDATYSATELGYLLHKHPEHLHERQTSAGKVSLFYSRADDKRTTAVMYLDVDPIALVRGKTKQSDGLLTQYVNDRPYAANSFLSVAILRTLGQSRAGKSKSRQALADRKLPFEARLVPVVAAEGVLTARTLFKPLGYDVECDPPEAGDGAFSLTLKGTVRLADLLTHLYVLLPVLDNSKHYWIDEAEVENLLDKGKGWLEDHPAKALIAQRAFKHRRSLARVLLEQLAEGNDLQQDDQQISREQPEEKLEKPLRLHDLRLDTVMDVLREHRVESVIDLGCGEGKLLRRLKADRSFRRIVGVDPSTTALERASEKLHLIDAGDAMRERIKLQMGSLTYADRRWQGFDAATLVEVIEHIEPSRLNSLALSLFGDARPGLIVMTTPNREYNVLFEGLAAGELRHPDHRFEWTRSEFEDWCNQTANSYGYEVAFDPIGSVDETVGAPSQMAIFRSGA